MDELEAKVKNYLKEIDAILDDIEKTKGERMQIRRSLEEVKATLQERFIAQNTARLNVIQAEEKRNEIPCSLFSFFRPDGIQLFLEFGNLYLNIFWRKATKQYKAKGRAFCKTEKLLYEQGGFVRAHDCAG